MSLTLPQIIEAKERIQGYLAPTPLVRCQELEKHLEYKGRILFKMDSENPTGSFKVRGAFNNLLLRIEEIRDKGVITRSSGNFAQAVAYAAKELKVAATIIMPDNAPMTKVEGTKKFGPHIEFTGPRHEEGEALVAQLAAEKGLIPIHPYNDYRTMAGQGTAALEVLEQCPEIEYFFCPIGGGGLLSGCSTALKEIKEAVKIYGIEPSGAGDYHASRKLGERQVWKTVNTIADGLRASSVGELNYPILNKYVDFTDVVSEEEIKNAMKILKTFLDAIIEPSGAVALAGFLKNHHNLQGTVVIFVSGKNVDPEPFQKWIEEA